MEQKKQGRTWADFFSENVLILSTLFIIVVIAIIYLSNTGKTITTSGIYPSKLSDTISKDKSLNQSTSVDTNAQVSLQKKIKSVERTGKKSVLITSIDSGMQINSNGGMNQGIIGYSNAKNLNIGSNYGHVGDIYNTKPARHINDALMQGLMEVIPNSQMSIHVGPQMQDVEALDFAKEIFDFLKKSGYSNLHFYVWLGAHQCPLINTTYGICLKIDSSEALIVTIPQRNNVTNEINK